eukprot:767946-Hanusia_phi.AAC.2
MPVDLPTSLPDQPPEVHAVGPDENLEGMRRWRSETRRSRGRRRRKKKKKRGRKWKKRTIDQDAAGDHHVLSRSVCGLTEDPVTVQSNFALVHSDHEGGRVVAGDMVGAPPRPAARVDDDRRLPSQLPAERGVRGLCLLEGVQVEGSNALVLEELVQVDFILPRQLPCHLMRLTLVDPVDRMSLLRLGWQVLLQAAMQRGTCGSRYVPPPPLCASGVRPASSCNMTNSERL